ncbi:MAG: serine/threonine-protein kinase, partial [Planctomycetota bacterium]
EYQDYLPLGEIAAQIAGDFFSVDVTPGPDAAATVVTSDDESESPSAIERRQRKSAPQSIAGKYKLLHQIGAGGMGTVWLAQQEQPVRRRVAIKVIRGNLDSRETINRFEAERQALAMMNHPNIAQVLDAGTMEDGSPFFVMELVKGIPLTRYCNENRLTIQQRLELLIAVCNAVQHAHQKGIVHRDIKPSNILVALQDNKPTPKVIDFGLAKALEHQHKLTEETMFTEHGRLVGTLQFMSPEQAGSNELDVDARTDIYSLGVVLYQLLIGATPLNRSAIANNTLLQIVAIICEEEIKRPSQHLQQNTEEQMLVSQQRRIESRKLLQLLRGELDWIALKALEKDRTRRYQTANALANDLHRFLDGEAITAKPPSTSYLLQKFVHRNRGWVASILLATILLLAGAVTSTYFAFKANRLKNRADSQLDVYLNSFASTNPLTGAKKNMSAVDVLQNAETNLEKKLADDPIGQAALLHEIGKSYRGQSRYDLAINALSKASELRKAKLGMADVETLASYSELAKSYQFSDLEKMLSIMTEVHSWTANRFNEGDDELVKSQHNLGTASFVTFKELKKKGDLRPQLIQAAEKLLTSAFEARKTKFGIDHVDTLASLTNLANVHLKKGDLVEALKLTDLAIEKWTHRLNQASSDRERNSALAMLSKTQNNYAEALYADNRPEEALAVYYEVLNRKQKLLGYGHKSWQTSFRLILDTLVDTKGTEEAQAFYDQQVSLITSALDASQRDVVIQQIEKEKAKVVSKYDLDHQWQPGDDD